MSTNTKTVDRRIIRRKHLLKSLSRRCDERCGNLVAARQRGLRFLENEIVKGHTPPRRDFAARLVEFDNGLACDPVFQQPMAFIWLDWKKRREAGFPGFERGSGPPNMSLSL